MTTPETWFFIFLNRLTPNDLSRQDWLSASSKMSSYLKQKKDCEFVGILCGLPYLTSSYNIMLWFDLRVTKTTGWRRKVKTYVKLTNENLEPLPSYVMLFYDPRSFPKEKRYLPKEMKPSKSPREEKIGKDTKSIRNAKVKNQNSAHAWTFKADILHWGQKTSKWLMYKQRFGQVLSLLAW